MTAPAMDMTEQADDFLKFFKSRYLFFHLSNVFFRDLHYGVMAYFDKNGVGYSYRSAEAVARDLARYLEEKKIFHRINERTWLLQYPQFKAIAKKKAPARPSPRPAPAAAKPAAKPAPAATVPAGTARQEPKTAPPVADAKPSPENQASSGTA